MKHIIKMLAIVAGASLATLTNLLALRLALVRKKVFRLVPVREILRCRLRPRWALCMCMFALPLGAWAATIAPATSAATPTPSWLSALIPVAVPIAIAGLKLLVPKLPGWTLPTIAAPLFGLCADLALHYAGVTTLGPVWGALLGSAGVGLREIQDQVKQQVSAPPTAQPPTPSATTT